MITNMETFTNNFLFGKAETCDVKSRFGVLRCSKHKIVPGIEVVALMEQNDRENFLRRMSRESGAVDVIILPEKKVAIDLTGEIVRSLGGNQWDWVNEDMSVPMKFDGGDLYGCYIGTLVSAVRDWFKADLAALAVKEAQKFPKDIGYAQREAYDAFLNEDKAEDKVEKELNAVITRDGYNSDLYFSSEILADYLLHRDDDALRKQWAAKFFHPDYAHSVYDRAVMFGNWYQQFIAAYNKYAALPDTAPEKQYRELLTAIRCAQNVQATFARVNDSVKESVRDINAAVMEYVRNGDTTIGCGSAAHELRNLQEVKYRGKTIWKRR